MPLFWLRIAVIFYGVGLLYSFFGLSRKSDRLTRLVIPATALGALLLGFPFMTIGLVAGSVVAEAQFGSAFFLDPKILLSLLMWAMYMLLLFTHWNSGWRGRRAAFLSSFAFLIALVAFAANYFSGVHRFLQS